MATTQNTFETALISHPAPWKISQRPAHEKGRRALPWQVLDSNGGVVALFSAPMAASIMVAALNDYLAGKVQS